MIESPGSLDIVEEVPSCRVLVLGIDHGLHDPDNAELLHLKDLDDPGFKQLEEGHEGADDLELPLGRLLPARRGVFHIQKLEG